MVAPLWSTARTDSLNHCPYAMLRRFRPRSLHRTLCREPLPSRAAPNLSATRRVVAATLLSYGSLWASSVWASLWLSSSITHSNNHNRIISTLLLFLLSTCLYCTPHISSFKRKNDTTTRRKEMAQKRRPTSYFSFNDDSILFYLVCVFFLLSPLRLKNLFFF